MTDQIRVLITQRNFHHKKPGSSFDWQTYRSLRNKITVTIKRGRGNIIQTSFKKIRTILANYGMQSSLQLVVIFSQIQSLEIDGEDNTSPKQISSSFAAFFKFVTANLPQTLPVLVVPRRSPQLLTDAQFSLSQITEDFVYKQLKALNSRNHLACPIFLYS